MKWAFAALVGVLCASCASTTTMTQTQLDALESRELEAPADRAFDAASHALVEAGYSIQLTDRDAGVLTGSKQHEPGIAPRVGVAIASVVLTMGHGMLWLPPTEHGVCVQVLPLSGSRSGVRVCVYRDDVAISDPAVVDQVWTLMQRRALGPSVAGG